MKLTLLLAALSMLPVVSLADAASDNTLPGPGYNVDRYSSLWSRSPFAVATPEASASQDYQLVGLAQFDGVSYASLVDKQTHEHFVLASDKPIKNLKLISVSRGADGVTAVVARNGETLTLKQDTSTPPTAIANPPNNLPRQPGQMNPSVGGVIAPPVFVRPNVRFHRPPVQAPSPPSTP